MEIIAPTLVVMISTKNGKIPPKTFILKSIISKNSSQTYYKTAIFTCIVTYMDTQWRKMHLFMGPMTKWTPEKARNSLSWSASCSKGFPLKTAALSTQTKRKYPHEQFSPNNSKTATFTLWKAHSVALSTRTSTLQCVTSSNWDKSSAKPSLSTSPKR